MRKIFFSFIAVLMLASPALAFPQGQQPRTQQGKELYEKAIKLGAIDKDYARACDAFKKVTLAEPAFAPAYNGWGISLANTGKYSAAVEKYKKATQLDPKLVRAYYNWGVSLSALKQHNEAVGKFQKAIALDPACIPAYNNLGMELTELGRYDEAIDKFKTAARLDPASAKSMDAVIKNVRKMKAANKR